MGFKEYKVLIRKESKITIDDAIKKMKKDINTKQDSDKYVLWAANIFDLRTLKEYLVFSDKACKQFDINDKYTTDDKTEVSGVLKLGQKIMDAKKLISENLQKNNSNLKSIIDDEIEKNETNLKNEILTINASTTSTLTDRITLLENKLIEKGIINDGLK